MTDLAAIIKEGERLLDPEHYHTTEEMGGYFYQHGPLLLRVARAARGLVSALDYVTPDWREKTCVIDENSDEVNASWCELEAAMEHEPSTPEQIAAAFDAAREGKP